MTRHPKITAPPRRGQTVLTLTRGHYALRRALRAQAHGAPCASAHNDRANAAQATSAHSPRTRAHYAAPKISASAKRHTNPAHRCISRCRCGLTRTGALTRWHTTRACAQRPRQPSNSRAGYAHAKEALSSDEHTSSCDTSIGCPPSASPHFCANCLGHTCPTAVRVSPR